MALSEQERRALEEIETALTNDSRHLADRMRNAHPGWLARHRAVATGRRWLWLARLLLGALLMVIGLTLASGFGTVLAVTGYLLIVTAVHSILDARRRRRA